MKVRIPDEKGPAIVDPRHVAHAAVRSDDNDGAILIVTLADGQTRQHTTVAYDEALEVLEQLAGDE